MAQQQIVELVDDLHGGPATQTVHFALDRKPLVIDLDDTNADRLRSALAEYIAHARFVGGSRMAKSRALATRTPTTRVELEPPAADIRAWAKGQGIPVSPRGRIPDDVKRRYLDASNSKRGRRGAVR